MLKTSVSSKVSAPKAWGSSADEVVGIGGGDGSLNQHEKLSKSKKLSALEHAFIF